jgi:hypothetical protein
MKEGSKYTFKIDKQYKIELQKADQTKKLTLDLTGCQKGDKISIYSSN